MDSFRKSHSSASGLAVQWLGDKWEMLLGVSIMIKITAITRATLLTRDREKVLRASNAPLDSKLLLQRCSSSPSPARAGSAPHNWGVPRALQQAGVTVPIRSWAFCSFLVWCSVCLASGWKRLQVGPAFAAGTACTSRFRQAGSDQRIFSPDS